MAERPPPWEVRDARWPPGPRGREFNIERGTQQDGSLERAATCWDYGLACVIEAALNMRDGTTE